MRVSNEMMEKLIVGGVEINCVRLDGFMFFMFVFLKVDRDNVFVINMKKY